MSSGEYQFYDYQTSCLKIYFENENEIDNFIKGLNYFKNGLFNKGEDKINEIHINK